MLGSAILRTHVATERLGSWPSIWAAALTRPTVASFADLLTQPHSAQQVSYSWLLASTMLSGTILAIATLLRKLGQPASGDLWLATPLYVLLALGSWLLFAGCTQWLARQWHGRGAYSDLLYTFAAFSAPLSIVTTLLSLLPYHRLASLSLYGYWFVLYVVALQAVHGISWRRATVVLLCACAMLLLVAISALVGLGYFFL